MSSIKILKSVIFARLDQIKNTTSKTLLIFFIIQQFKKTKETLEVNLPSIVLYNYIDVKPKQTRFHTNVEDLK